MGFTRYIVEENNFPPESNYPILDNFSISFLLKNFNHKFANSSFFGKRKTVCPVKLVKQPLQEHLLTTFNFFLFYFTLKFRTGI